MRKVLSLALGTALLATPLWALDEKKSDAKPDKSPAEQFKALKAEFEEGNKAFQDALPALQAKFGKAKTDEEKKAVQEEARELMSKRPNPRQLAEKFFAIAEENPDDPVAFDALLWVATNAGTSSSGRKALEVLVEKHVQDKRIGPLCHSLIRSRTGEKTLREILEKNTDREVQGHATFALASLMKGKSESRRSENPKEEAAEAEKLFDKVQAKFADVPHGEATLGDAAENHLFVLRNLGIGKVVPEIEGEDMDGKSFKISDYRGKVVMLDFWGHW